VEHAQLILTSAAASWLHVLLKNLAMVRKLKHHEQKLLRKVDFITYDSDNNHKDAAVIGRYAIQNPSDYEKYNRICGVRYCFSKTFFQFSRLTLLTFQQNLRQLAHKLAALEPSDPVRQKHEELLLEKLWDMGILGTGGGGRGKLSEVERKVTVSAFARRRLPVVMTRLRMCETVQAVSYCKF